MYEYRECGTAYVRARNGGVVRIEDVKVMRGFAYDLISEGKLEEKGARMITGGGVKKITKEGRTILRLEKDCDNLYRVPVARVSEEDHRRMKGTEPAMRVAEDPDEEEEVPGIIDDASSSCSSSAAEQDSSGDGRQEKKRMKRRMRKKKRQQRDKRRKAEKIKERQRQDEVLEQAPRKEASKRKEIQRKQMGANEQKEMASGEWEKPTTCSHAQSGTPGEQVAHIVVKQDSDDEEEGDWPATALRTVTIGKDVSHSGDIPE